jgi:phosphopentomutase/2,3-bisphosphoglycerate-independent phosphoglycerate mutase family metalloenzyme
MHRSRAGAAAILWLGIAAAPLPVAAQQRATENVVLIVTDGFRWQELFRGADSTLINEEYGRVEDTAALRRDFILGSPAANRRALLPFLWDSVAQNGQLYGNRDLGSSAQVTNGLKFSYPGYNEMLTGKADPRIDRNSYGPNPNVTVFEWLGRQPGFEGKVAAFGSWDAFAEIFNRDRAGIHVHAAWETPFPDAATPTSRLLNQLYATTTRIWDGMTFDAYLQAVVVEYLSRNQPRVLYLGFGETDEWAHEGRYDLYLRAAHQVDQFIADLWRTLQGMPGYAGKTTFIITTDHGRGGGLEQWRDHGREVEGAEYVWVAVLGPDTGPRGERRDTVSVTQAQVAATVAALLGFDWPAASPGAAGAMADVIR